MGNGAHGAACQLHALLPDIIVKRASLEVIDTNESWQWLLECWKAVYRGAGVKAGERVFFPFSFGPFLGFWAGFEAGPQIGLHCVPGGGMSSQIRLSMIEAIGATVVCCTPTYTLGLRRSLNSSAGSH